MKVEDNAELQFPRFANNDSFVTFSPGGVGLDQPYVTSEISASRYDSARNYVLGDNSSLLFNDQPQLYVNGPLDESTTYTAFVWAFPQRPEVRGGWG